MARHRLDTIDRQILAELQSDGRMTNVDLAQRVNITAPPCLRRVRALEKAGYLKGYHADLDAKSLGFEVTAFAFVGRSRNRSGPGRRCAPATCSRARWISSSCALPAICRTSRTL